MKSTLEENAEHNDYNEYTNLNNSLPIIIEQTTNSNITGNSNTLNTVITLNTHKSHIHNNNKDNKVIKSVNSKNDESYNNKQNEIMGFIDNNEESAQNTDDDDYLSDENNYNLQHSIINDNNYYDDVSNRNKFTYTLTNKEYKRLTGNASVSVIEKSISIDNSRNSSFINTVKIDQVKKREGKEKKEKKEGVESKKKISSQKYNMYRNKNQSSSSSNKDKLIKDYAKTKAIKSNTKIDNNNNNDIRNACNVKKDNRDINTLSKSTSKSTTCNDIKSKHSLRAPKTNSNDSNYNINNHNYNQITKLHELNKQPLKPETLNLINRSASYQKSLEMKKKFIKLQLEEKELEEVKEKPVLVTDQINSTYIKKGRFNSSFEFRTQHFNSAYKIKKEMRLKEKDLKDNEESGVSYRKKKDEIIKKKILESYVNVNKHNNSSSLANNDIDNSYCLKEYDYIEKFNKNSESHNYSNDCFIISGDRSVLSSSKDNNINNFNNSNNTMTYNKPYSSKQLDTILSNTVSRLYSWNLKKQNKLILKKQESLNKPELVECTFHPTISNNSEIMILNSKLNRNDNYDYSVSNNNNNNNLGNHSKEVGKELKSQFLGSNDIWVENSKMKFDNCLRKYDIIKRVDDKLESFKKDRKEKIYKKRHHNGHDDVGEDKNKECGKDNDNDNYGFNVSGSSFSKDLNKTNNINKGFVYCKTSSCKLLHTETIDEDGKSRVIKYAPVFIKEKNNFNLNTINHIYINSNVNTSTNNNFDIKTNMNFDCGNNKDYKKDYLSKFLNNEDKNDKTFNNTANNRYYNTNSCIFTTTNNKNIINHDNDSYGILDPISVINKSLNNRMYFSTIKTIKNDASGNKDSSNSIANSLIINNKRAYYRKHLKNSLSSSTSIKARALKLNIYNSKNDTNTTLLTTSHNNNSLSTKPNYTQNTLNHINRVNQTKTELLKSVISNRSNRKNTNSSLISSNKRCLSLEAINKNREKVFSDIKAFKNRLYSSRKQKESEIKSRNDVNINSHIRTCSNSNRKEIGDYDRKTGLDNSTISTNKNINTTNEISMFDKITTLFSKVIKNRNRNKSVVLDYKNNNDKNNDNTGYHVDSSILGMNYNDNNNYNNVNYTKIAAYKKRKLSNKLKIKYTKTKDNQDYWDNRKNDSLNSLSLNFNIIKNSNNTNNNDNCYINDYNNNLTSTSFLNTLNTINSTSTITPSKNKTVKFKQSISKDGILKSNPYIANSNINNMNNINNIEVIDNTTINKNISNNNNSSSSIINLNNTNNTNISVKSNLKKNEKHINMKQIILNNNKMLSDLQNHILNICDNKEGI